jgi:hypothetical protein
MNNKLDLEFLIKGVDKVFEKYPEIKVCSDKFKTLFDLYDGEDWKDHIQLNDKEYQRKIIHQTENYDLMLLSWNTGQGTAIHNHPAAGCLMKVLSGKLKEDRFSCEDLNLIGTTEVNENSFSYIEDSMGYHSITNASESGATFSLHLYSPPNFQQRKFYLTK